MKKKIILFLLIFITAQMFVNSIQSQEMVQEQSVTIDGLISQNEYENSLFLDSLNEFKLSYSVINETIYFGLEGLSKGWLAIGFDPSNFSSTLHKGADIYSGAFDNKNNKPIASDRFGKDYEHSPSDSTNGGTNDILSFDCSQNDSWTVFEFSRKLVTGDYRDNDILLEHDHVVMWAYHFSKDSFGEHHTSEGMTLIVFHVDTFIPPTPDETNPQSGSYNVSVDGQINIGEYSNSLYLDSLYKFRLSYLIKNETIFFGILINAHGWSALGIDPSNPLGGGGHTGADILMGTFDTISNVPKCSDEFGNSANNHLSDELLGGTNDILEFMASEDPSYTTIEFSRYLNISDTNDKKILVETPQYIMWAFHSTSDDFTSMHSSRGYYEISFHLPNENGTSTEPPVSTPPPESTNPPPPAGETSGPVDGVISIDEYVYSEYLDSMLTIKMFYRIENDTIYIGLVSEGLGWIAIGFSNENPGTVRHKGSDIVIASYIKESNTTIYGDEYGSSSSSHVSDISLGGTNDILNIQASENSTSTIVEFSRKLSSTDSYDNNLFPGEATYIIWAYQKDNDDLKSYHSERGYILFTFEIYPQNETPPTQSETTSKPVVDNPTSSTKSDQITNPLNQRTDPIDKDKDTPNSITNFETSTLVMIFIGSIAVTGGVSPILYEMVGKKSGRKIIRNFFKRK